jgi:2-polyprenyl-3-methyl-5-hydroxy-6-metoxy-1,4-benzoquinol methylase
MEIVNRQAHWQGVYETKAANEVSWFAAQLQHSLQYIVEVTSPKARVIDVGGGASTLVDDLLGRGYRDVTVLDVADAALEVSRRRLGVAAGGVTWIAADVTKVELEAQRYDLWHDRAVLHFLTERVDREAYVDLARRSIPSGGYMVLATFSTSGPTKCSGLDVVRYDAQSLSRELGEAFVLDAHKEVTHLTPAGREQQFLYCRFKKQA